MTDHWRYDKDVLVEGRRLLASMRITTEYPPVLSAALRDLEETRACLKELWGKLRMSEKVAQSELGERIEALMEKWQ